MPGLPRILGDTLDLRRRILQGSRLLQDELLHLLHASVKETESRASRILHSLAIHAHLDSIPLVGDHFIRAFTSSVDLLESCLAFCRVSKPSSYTLNAVISALVYHGENQAALGLYHAQYPSGGCNARKVVFPCILKACMGLTNSRQGHIIHNEVVCQNLECDVVIGSTLINMYAKCGFIEDAYRIFNSFPCRNVVLWNNMLAAYVQHSNILPDPRFFADMQLEGIQPDKVMYISIIKACVKMGLMMEGRIIHGQITMREVTVDPILGSTLINMYSQCGSLEDACKVYEDLPRGNLALLGAMIAAYVELGHDLCALELLVQMVEITDTLDKGTFFYALRACSNLKSLLYVQLLHDQLIKVRLDSELILINTLIDSYCKCESLLDARNIFNALKKLDVVTFGIMMAGYLQHGLSDLSLELFWRMISRGMKPDEATYICSLKASHSISVSKETYCIHCQIVRDGLELNPAIGKALVETYAKHKCLRESYTVFKSLSDRKVVLWTAMMTSYVEQGYGQEALDMFDKMQKETVVLDELSLMCALKACIMTRNSEKGKIVHSFIAIRGFDEDEALGSTLISMYFSCGKQREGQNVFDSLPQQNVVTWSVLISGYADSGCNTVPFELLDDMLQKGVQPDRVILLCILKVCTTSGTIAHGKLVHHQILKHGLSSDFLGNALIDMYGKIGSPMEAQNVFDRLQTPNVISWTSIVAAHAEGGYLHNALESFQNMQKEGMDPNTVTFLCTIKACCNAGVLQEGRLIHHVGLEFGLDNEDAIGSALIDMYAKCDMVEDAYMVFSCLSHPDAVTWGSMITAFGQHGHEFSALKLFERMQEKGVNANTATFLCILKACSNVGAIGQGQWMHDLILKGEFCSDSYLGNALVSMYATFGSMDDAYKVFSRLSEQDRIAWEAMISGFSKQGNSESVKQCFVEMQKTGIHPLETTYSSILAGCSHSGHVQEGPFYFNHIGEASGISPREQHFNCMVDLFGRTGDLKAANEMLLSMPGNPNVVGWVTLLSACRAHGNLGLGRLCFEHAAQHFPELGAGYVLMSNLYADTGMWEDVQGLHEQRRSMGAWKKPGQACIAVSGTVQMFTVGDFGSFDGDSLCVCLDRVSRVMKREGYIPYLWAYSEALPIAGGQHEAH